MSGKNANGRKQARTKQDSPTRAREAALSALSKWKGAFLAALSIHGNITAAARAVGITRSWAYECKSLHPDFAAAWEEALQEATDALEEKARALAMGEGRSYKFTKSGAPILHPVTKEPYYEECVSGSMLALLLKAKRPDEFKDRSAVEHSGAVAVAAVDLSKLPDKQLQELESILRLIVPTPTP